jgi:hypothetical protein
MLSLLSTARTVYLIEKSIRNGFTALSNVLFLPIANRPAILGCNKNQGPAASAPHKAGPVQIAADDYEAIVGSAEDNQSESSGSHKGRVKGKNVADNPEQREDACLRLTNSWLKPNHQGSLYSRNQPHQN